MNVGLEVNHSLVINHGQEFSLMMTNRFNTHVVIPSGLPAIEVVMHPERLEMILHTYDEDETGQDETGQDETGQVETGLGRNRTRTKQDGRNRTDETGLGRKWSLWYHNPPWGGYNNPQGGSIITTPKGGL